MSTLPQEKRLPRPDFELRVIEILGYEDYPPESIRQLIQRLRTQGYSVEGAAKHVLMVITANEMSGQL